MPRAVWSGSLSFGLVNVPVALFSAVRDLDLRFHQLHARDGAPIEMRSGGDQVVLSEVGASPRGDTSWSAPPRANGTAGGAISGNISAARRASSTIRRRSAAVSPPGRWSTISPLTDSPPGNSRSWIRIASVDSASAGRKLSVRLSVTSASSAPSGAKAASRTIQPATTNHLPRVR